MKNKLSFILFLSILSISSLVAQRVAVVDVNAVLDNLTDYQAAQNEVDQVTAKWRQEIAQEYDKIKSCLLYTSPSPRDATLSRMPSSA